MDVRVGLWRKLSTEELMLLNYGVGEDSWESLGLQGDPTSPFWRSALGISLEGMMLKLKLQYFGHLMRRADSLEKTLDAGRDWGQEEKGTTEDEMAGWHHWLDGRESQWTPGVGDGQGGLACCDSLGRRVRHDWATELTEYIINKGKNPRQIQWCMYVINGTFVQTHIMYQTLSIWTSDDCDVLMYVY